MSPEERPATAAEHLDLDAAIELHLEAARQAADGNSRWWEVRNGAIIERVMSHLNAAEADLLRRAPAKYVCGQISHIVSHVRQHLPTDDPQRLRVEELVEEVCDGHLDAYAREALIHAVRAASLEARREFTRVRSFRNVLLVTAAILTAAAVGTAVWGAVRPAHLGLCFHPQQRGVQVCPIGPDPTGADIVLIQFIGLLAAAVTGSAALRNVSGTSTRLGLPVGYRGDRWDQLVSAMRRDKKNRGGEIRLVLLDHHYRTPWNWTDDALATAAAASVASRTYRDYGIASRSSAGLVYLARRAPARAAGRSACLS